MTMNEEQAEPADVAAALDLLLTDASRGMLRRFLPNRSMARFGMALARKPDTVARPTRSCGA